MARVEVRTRLVTPEGLDRFRCGYSYTISGTGHVRIEVDVLPIGEMPALPRIGLQLRVPKEFDRLEWYGRGPHETYPDRKLGARVGLYGEPVALGAMPYVMPQDYGNKTDVRWAALTDRNGAGLMASSPHGGPLLQTSAHPFSTRQLDEAKHTFVLYDEGAITWNLDFAVCGVGNGSCGPATLPQYQVPPKPMRYVILVKPTAERHGFMLLRQGKA